MVVINSGIDNRHAGRVETFLASGPRLVGLDDFHVPLGAVGVVPRVGRVVLRERRRIV